MKGFLPDSIFNPFDTAYPNNPGLADIALVHWLQQQTAPQANTFAQSTDYDADDEEEDW